MRKISLIIVLALATTQAWAEDAGSGRWAKRFWRASIAAVAAGSAMDMQSSWAKHESNSLLANRQGTFSMQGVGLKLVIAGAAVGTQQFLLHRHPAAAGYRTGAIINFAVAGALTGAAIHNYHVQPVR